MAKEEKKEDEKLTPVGDGVETSEVVEKEEKEVKGEIEDQKVGHGEETEEEDDPEEDGEVDPERQRIRERRKREKQNRSRRIASDRRELEFLRKRNDEVERKLSQVSLRQDQQEDLTVDGRIGHLEGQIREAEGIHAQAIEAKDGTTATEALRVRDALRDTLNDLKGSKKDRQKDREQQRTTESPREENRPPAEAVRYGTEWVRRNSEWFDPKLSDEDSFLARAVEERMAREGEFDPATPEYWKELDRRIDKRLPGIRKKMTSNDDVDDIFGEDDERPVKKPAVKRAGGPRIAVGGKTRSLKANEVYLSAERKKALMEAGVWDDDEKRERYLKSYKRYDEDAARNS